MLRSTLFALAACSPYSPDLGSTPFLCGDTEPKCPDGYACVAIGGKNLCSNGGTPTDGHPSDGSGSGTCTMPFTGVLGTWTLTGQPGSQASTAGTSSAPGVTAGPLARSTGLTSTAATNSINSSNWPTSAALDTTKYYTFAIIPPSGCGIAATSLSIDVLSSGTGPASASVGTSADSFAHTTVVSTTAPSMPSLTATVGSMLELRVYGFAASATTGTMRIQNTLTVSGAVQ